MRGQGSGFWVLAETTVVDGSRRESTGIAGRRPHGLPTPAFTLIELLAVVMLLTVLMLTAFPAFRGLQRAANRHRAVAEADALAQAALAYRRAYGQWPLEDRANSSGADSVLIAGRGVAEHLSLADVTAVLRGALPDQNPHRTLFLELPDDRLDSDGTPLDPWRQPYVLLMARGDRPTRAEGGIRTDRPIYVDSPEDAVAFSWGDPASARTNRTIGSWSKR
ncbi:MAG: type II secretion system protein [Kiritimatiellae bacterium]|nr:type II secretion system protein [Kiritimatiellia bacterium]